MMDHANKCDKAMELLRYEPGREYHSKKRSDRYEFPAMKTWREKYDAAVKQRNDAKDEVKRIEAASKADPEYAKSDTTKKRLEQANKAFEKAETAVNTIKGEKPNLGSAMARLLQAVHDMKAELPTMEPGQQDLVLQAIADVAKELQALQKAGQGKAASGDFS